MAAKRLGNTVQRDALLTRLGIDPSKAATAEQLPEIQAARAKARSGTPTGTPGSLGK